MTEDELYAAAYNAHEGAENAIHASIMKALRSQPVEALACLADPSWRWETRSCLSPWIVDYANEVLNEKLNAMIGANSNA